MAAGVVILGQQFKPRLEEVYGEIRKMKQQEMESVMYMSTTTSSRFCCHSAAAAVSGFAYYGQKKQETVENPPF